METSYIRTDGVYRSEENMSTIPECLLYYAQQKQDIEAVVFADYDGGRQAVTWQDLYKKSLTVAHSLRKLGVKEGEMVAMNIRPCPEWLYLHFGAMMAGAVPVNVSFTYSDGSDLQALMEKLGKCCLLAFDLGDDGNNWNIVQLLLDYVSEDGNAKSSKMRYLRYLVAHEKGKETVMRGVKHVDELLSEDVSTQELPTLHEDGIASMIQTSGSTGIPKLTVRTHRSLLAMRQSLTDSFFDPSIVMYNDRPFSWIGGYPHGIFAGQKRVTVSGFCRQPEDKLTALLDIIEKERCTGLLALPPLLHSLIRRMPTLPENWPLIKVFTGGQPLTKVIAEAVGRVAAQLVVLYGSSEAHFPFKDLITEKKTFKEFCAGKKLEIPGLEAKVVDDAGELVPVNVRGELYLRGPIIFKEYCNDPEKTKAVLTKDGWYRTDDIAMISNREEVFIYGRKSNMIISGGFNVAPEVLEHAMRSCPGIDNVVVVPVPDNVYYQVVCACVVPKAGSNLTESQLRNFCSDIHNDKSRVFTVIPTYYMFLDKFPETSTGKTSRPLLTKMAVEKFSGKGNQ